MPILDAFPGPGGIVDATELRKDLAGTIARDSSGNPRPGVFYRSSTPFVTARADMKYDVGGFHGASVRGGGPLYQANDGVQTVSTTTAPISNSCYDIIYFKQNESTAPYADGNNSPQLAVYRGATGAPPDLAATLAALAIANPGAVPLYSALIPSTATATNSAGVVIKEICQFTAAAGGVVHLRDQTDEDAWTPGNGAIAYRLDTGGLRVRRGGAWTSGGSLQYRSPVTTGTFTNAFVSKAAVTLPKGIYDLSGIVEVNHSTTTPHIYDAQIWNATDSVAIASGQLYLIAGTLRLTLNIGDSVTLAAQKIIQLRVKLDGAEGTQLLSAGQLRATEVGALL